MRRIVLGVGALLLCAALTAAQDMPLAQILIDGEGWQVAAAPPKRAAGPGFGFDFVVARNGSTYCTVPAEKAVYLITPDGKKRLVDIGIAAPTGLVLSPDGNTLVVGDYEGKHLYAFRVDKDGSLTAKEPYYTMRLLTDQTASGARGMTIDTEGRVYVSTFAGVQVFDPTGRLSGVLSKPAPLAPVAMRNTQPRPLFFGGTNRDILYLVGDKEVFARKLKSKGLPLPVEPEK